MASDKFVMTRPIYIGTDAKDFTLDIGGGAVAGAIATGTYASIATVLQALEDALQVIAGSITISINTSFVVAIAGGGTSFTLVWTDTLLRDICGFTGNSAALVDDFTATYTPLYTWLPDKVRADRDLWHLDHKMLWSGTPTGGGGTPGLSTGDRLYKTAIRLDFETDTSLFYSRATTTFQRERCLDTFVLGDATLTTTGCRDAWPGTSGEPSAAGFYFYPDYTDCQPVTSMDAGGAQDFSLAAGAETYAFCQFDADWMENYKAALPVGRTYYGLDMKIHSVATAPMGGGSWVT